MGYILLDLSLVRTLLPDSPSTLPNMRLSIWSVTTTFIWCTALVSAQYFPLTGTQTGRTQSGSWPARQNILNLQNDVAKLSENLI